MKPALRVGLAASLLLITLAFVWKPASPVTRTKAPGSATGSAALAPPVSAVAQVSSSNAPTEPGSSPIPLVKSGTYLAQVRANHHRTPQILIEFSNALAERMAQARKSSVDARQAFQELSTCALRPPSEQPVSASAACAVNAAELAELFPRELAADYEAIRSELPIEVAETAAAIRD